MIVIASLLFGGHSGVLVPNQLLRIPIRVTQERPTSEKPCSTAPSDASGEGTVIFTPLGLPLESMSMDEFLLGFHGKHPPAARGDAPRVSVTRMRTAAKAWEEVPGQGGLRYRDAAAGGEVTLGDFQARIGAAMAAEGDADPLPRHEKAGFSEDPVNNGRFHEQEQQSLLQTPMSGSGNGVASGGGGGRSRKRPSLDDLMDKVDLRRQKRMIKNRESALRSRQRKQVRNLLLLLLGASFHSQPR